MNIVKQIVPESKYGIKCPYYMTPDAITVHNTANDASARNEIAYMTNNNYETSFHFAVDDIEAVQGLPLDRNGWHAGDGNGYGNRNTIGIEICYSLSGGDRFIKAEQNAVELIVMLLKQYEWGIEKVMKHQDHSGKYCPHRTLDMGWERFLNMIREKLYPKELSDTDIYYQAYTDRWLPNVLNTTDYAGIYGQPITAIFANSSANNDIIYQVHTIADGWLPEVMNRIDYAGIYGRTIDGVRMKSTKGNLFYRVHLLGGDWLPIVKNYDDYAGIYGQAIDAIECYLEEIIEAPIQSENKDNTKENKEDNINTPETDKTIDNTSENQSEEASDEDVGENALIWLIDTIIRFFKKLFKKSK